jgi:hypothetical protein
VAKSKGLGGTQENIHSSSTFGLFCKILLLLCATIEGSASRIFTLIKGSQRTPLEFSDWVNLEWGLFLEYALLNAMIVA